MIAIKIKKKEGEGGEVVKRKRRNIKEWPPSNESGVFLRTFQSTMISKFPSLAFPWTSHTAWGTTSQEIGPKMCREKSAAFKVVVKGRLPLCLSTTARSTNVQRSTFTPIVCLWVHLALSWRVHSQCGVCFSEEWNLPHALNNSCTAMSHWVCALHCRAK